MQPVPDQHARFRRSLWAIVIFLLAFTVLLALLSWYFLLPAFDALRDATPRETRQLSALGVLLLAIVLVVVLCGLILTFRISRYFFPRPPVQRTHTKYVDAWSESARRLDEQWDADAADEEKP